MSLYCTSLVGNDYFIGIAFDGWLRSVRVVFCAVLACGLLLFYVGWEGLATKGVVWREKSVGLSVAAGFAGAGGED